MKIPPSTAASVTGTTDGGVQPTEAFVPVLRTRIFCLGLAAAAFLAIAVSARAGAGTARKVTFTTPWVPQAQFAGYYVAQEKGFYRSRGIDLEISHGGPDRSAVEDLKGGKADFAGMWLSTALQQRAAGFRLVNLGQIIQRSALMLVAKKASGIRTAADLQGKRVGLWGGDFAIQPRAFLKQHGLQVRIVPQSVTLNLFLRDGVDAASAMWYNEYHTILNAGLDPGELTTFFFQDFGLNFPEDGIYAREETYRADPALACALVHASLEGWAYAFSHPDEALDIVLKRMSGARIPANRQHQKWMLARLKDLVAPGDGTSTPGELRAADYESVAGTLQAEGFIAAVPSYEAFAARCASHGER